MNLSECGFNDYPQLIAILLHEGLSLCQMYIYEGDTWIVKEKAKVKGFFTLRVLNKRIFLQHLAVASDSRDASLAYFLIRHARKRAKELGFTELIYHAPKSKPKIAQILAYYTRKRPYAENDKAYWFVTKV